LKSQESVLTAKDVEVLEEEETNINIVVRPLEGTEGAKLVYIQDSKDASFETVDKSFCEEGYPENEKLLEHHKCGKLTLSCISPKTLWFTQEPVKKSGYLTMGYFNGRYWVEGDDSFKTDPPNADLIWSSGHKENNAVVDL